jgi:hypothetical protein
LSENTDITNTSEQENTTEPDKDLQERALVNYVESTYEDKQTRFYIYQVMGRTIKDSARLSGYSEQYGYNLAHKMRNNPAWLEKLKPLADNITTEYKTHHKLALPALWQVKLNALDKMRTDPEMVIKNPKLLRDMEQIAGAIEDEREARQVVNVDKMQVIIQGALGMNDIQTPKIAQNDVSD